MMRLVQIMIMLGLGFLPVVGQAQFVLDPSQLGQIMGQKSAESTNMSMRSGVEQYSGTILNKMGEFGLNVPSFGSVMPAGWSVTGASLPGVTPAQNPSDTKASEKQIAENLQIPDDASAMSQDKIEAVKKNQEAAQRDVGLSGITNAWMTQTNSGLFPDKVNQFSSLIASTKNQKDMVAVLSTITLAIATDANTLTGMAAQATQNTAALENASGGISVLKTGGAQ